MCGPNNPIHSILMPAIVKMAVARNNGQNTGSNGTQSQASFSGSPMASRLFGSGGPASGSTMLTGALRRPSLLGS